MSRFQHNSATCQLLRMLGSPLIGNSAPEPLRESKELFSCAFRNRIGLMYLDALRRSHKLDKLAAMYRDLSDREKETLITASRVSSVLRKANVDHVIVKTLRPYPATPNDVDVVCLGDKRIFKRGERALQEAGYVLLLKKQEQNGYCDPRGAYLLAENRHVDEMYTGGRYFLDFYRNLAADHFQYMDKSKLSNAVIKVSPVDSCEFLVLEPLSDLCTILMHSVFPHQRYGLESFYTITYRLCEAEPSEIQRFGALVRSYNLEYAAAAFLAVTHRVHTEVFGFVPPKLREALDAVGMLHYESRNFAQSSLDMPYVFSKRVVWGAVFWKLREKNALRSMLTQLVSMVRPSFFSDVMFEMRRKRALDHYRQL